MTQIQQLGFLANNLTVNTSANTATFNNILVVGNSSVNVVVNSSSVYVSGVALGSGGSTNVAAQYAWTNTQSFSNTITFTGAILANTVNATSYSVGTAVSINSTSMAVNAFSIGSTNTATFYNINGQANASAGAFVGNAYATLGGASGNYLAFGQQTSSAQWIQSGYSSAGAPVYYSIILNPLGGNIGIGNAAPTDRLSVNGNTYLQGTATVTGNTTVVNVYSTGTVNAAAVTVGTSFISNTSQLTVATPVSANGGVGTAGQVLTSNGATGSPYWSTVSGGGSTSVNVAAQYAWTNTQSFSAVVTHTANVSVNGAIIANGAVGTSGQVLTSSAGGNVYWSTISGGGGGGGFTNGQSISVANLEITGTLSAYGGAGSAGQVLTSNGTAVYWSTVAAGSSNTSSIVRQLFVANGTQNTFSVTSGYVPNFLDVYLNGVKLQTNLEANVQSGSTFTILGDTPVNNAVIEVVGLVGTPTINYTKNIKTFNITGSFAAPITGVSRYVPITNTNITTIRMINSANIVGADLIAQIYKNDVLDSSYSITAGNYTSFYSNANITLTTNDYLTINISQGIGNNFSITVSN